MLCIPLEPDCFDKTTPVIKGVPFRKFIYEFDALENGTTVVMVGPVTT
jgi:hypothetical protein